MDLLQRYTDFIQKYNLQNKHLLLAVSGGIDSVVLCKLSHQARLHFSIAHCNFGLRGEESERDEAFVRSLGNVYETSVHVKKFDTRQYANEKKYSVQEAARELRYKWFFELSKEKKADYTLLAHHADDNIETLQMHFFRGTGLEGLIGMDENIEQWRCLRPMLSIRRHEIEQYAKEQQIVWVEDSSNHSSKYTRNYFRNELIPSLKRVFPQVETNLLNNIERFQKTNTLYQELVKQLKQKLCKGQWPEVRIPVKQLMEYQQTSLLYEIIKDYGFGEKQIDEVIKLVASESGRYLSNNKYQIIKHRAWLIFSPISDQAQTYAIEKDRNVISFMGGVLEIKCVAANKVQINSSNETAHLDAYEIKYPLLLRPWKEGDYFYPLGMRKKKKLARFFIDQKLPKNRKEKIWVLESDNRIMWVVGMRIDDRFKITEKTKQVLQITLSNP